MDPNEWKLEMNRMLDSFANQAEFSLGKISRSFEALGRPFDEEFRKYYLEMSNQRYAMSFAIAIVEKSDWLTDSPKLIGFDHQDFGTCNHLANNC